MRTLIARLTLGLEPIVFLACGVYAGAVYNSMGAAPPPPRL